jgi:FixJ family two-component response regulator
MTDSLVYVIDDDPAIRNSLEWLLGSMHLKSRTCESAQQFLDHYQPDVPGCLLLDVRMPGMSGLDLQARLVADKSEVPVIVITGHADVPMAVRSLKLGAFDFIEKPLNDQIILDRVQRALQKDQGRCKMRLQAHQIKQRLAQLTQREREIMERVVSGDSNKAIASALGLSPKTVEVHRARVMAKMQAESLAELVRLGVFVHTNTGNH